MKNLKKSDLARIAVSTILAALGVVGVVYFSYIGLFGGYPHFYMWIISFVAAAVVAITTIWPNSYTLFKTALSVEKLVLITTTFDIFFISLLLFGIGLLQILAILIISMVWHCFFIKNLRVSKGYIDDVDTSVASLFVCVVFLCYGAILCYDAETVYQKEVNNFYEQPFHKINKVECNKNASGTQYVYTYGGEKLVVKNGIYTFYIEGGKKLTFSDGHLDVSAGDSIKYRFVNHDIVSVGLKKDFLYEIKSTR